MDKNTNRRHFGCSHEKDRAWQIRPLSDHWPDRYNRTNFSQSKSQIKVIFLGFHKNLGIQIWIEIPNGRILQPCSRLQPQFKRLHYPPPPFSSSDEGAANFAGYRDFCRLLKFSPISQQWHVLPKIFVFWFFASNPDNETEQKYKFERFQSCHSELKVPLLPSWNIDDCNFIYDDRILKIGNPFSLHFSRVILIYLSKFSLAFQLKAFLQRLKEEKAKFMYC